MAKNISMELFEKNAKILNKKGLRRTYSSIATRYSEYINFPPLGSTDKLIIEASLDKEYVESFIAFIKENNFEVLGGTNCYFIEKLVNDYEANKELFSNQKEAIENIAKDLVLMKDNNKEYEILENEDGKFYFLPYNNDIDTIFEFVGVYKDKILEYAQKNDLTVMLKLVGYCQQVDGFFGFNFFDDESQEEEITVDYASNITVLTDFKNPFSLYASGLILNGLGSNLDELKELNVSLVAENIKYDK